MDRLFALAKLVIKEAHQTADQNVLSVLNVPKIGLATIRSALTLASVLADKMLIARLSITVPFALVFKGTLEILSQDAILFLLLHKRGQSLLSQTLVFHLLVGQMLFARLLGKTHHALACLAT